MLKDEGGTLRVVFEWREDEAETDVLVLEAGGLGHHLIAVLLHLAAMVKSEI